MVTIKNRYQKVLFKIKNGEVRNSSGQVLAKVGEGELLNSANEPIAKIEGTDIFSVVTGEKIAQLSGTKVMSPEGSIMGYVDGKPFNQFVYGAAALVNLAY